MAQVIIVGLIIVVTFVPAVCMLGRASMQHGMRKRVREAAPWL